MVEVIKGTFERKMRGYDEKWYRPVRNKSERETRKPAV